MLNGFLPGAVDCIRTTASCLFCCASDKKREVSPGGRLRVSMPRSVTKEMISTIRPWRRELPAEETFR